MAWGFLTVHLVTPPAAASDAPTSHQVWSELQFQYGLAPTTDALAMANVTRQRETRTATEAQLGLQLNHRFSDIFTLGAGYRYGFALGHDPFREHRLLAEQTIHVALPADIWLSLRTRQELRWLNEGFSFRVRERVKVERVVELGSRSFTPYVSAEIYYDSRFDTISRGRVMLGAVFPIRPYLSIDIYGTRQSDWRPRTKHTQALGVSGTLNF
jgi:hypothetical protein